MALVVLEGLVVLQGQVVHLLLKSQLNLEVPADLNFLVNPKVPTVRMARLAQEDRPDLVAQENLSCHLYQVTLKVQEAQDLLRILYLHLVLLVLVDLGFQKVLVVLVDRHFLVIQIALMVLEIPVVPIGLVFRFVLEDHYCRLRHSDPCIQYFQ